MRLEILDSPGLRMTWKFWLTNVAFGGMSMLRAPPAMLLSEASTWRYFGSWPFG